MCSAPSPGAPADEKTGVAAARPHFWPALQPEVLARAQGGEREALGQLFDHYFDRIFGTVHRMLGEPFIAEDITQEVFLKVRRGIAGIDATRDLGPWLYTIAINACRDHLRSSSWRMAKSSVPIEDEAITSTLQSPAPDPEQTLLRAEDERRVQSAIARLPGPLRTAIVLHDCEGLSHLEIATITGVRHAAARKRHSRALMALAELLRKESSL